MKIWKIENIFTKTIKSLTSLPRYLVTSMTTISISISNSYGDEIITSVIESTTAIDDFLEYAKTRIQSYTDYSNRYKTGFGHAHQVYFKEYRNLGSHTDGKEENDEWKDSPIRDAQETPIVKTKRPSVKRKLSFSACDDDSANDDDSFSLENDFASIKI